MFNQFGVFLVWMVWAVSIVFVVAFLIEYLLSSLRGWWRQRNH
jgi:hypothetical protein